MLTPTLSQKKVKDGAPAHGRYNVEPRGLVEEANVAGGNLVDSAHHAGAAFFQGT